MDYLNRLPVDNVFKILKNLPYHDVLNFRLLNKHLCQIVNNYSCESLVISHSRMPVNRKWFKSYQPINLTNQIKTKDYGAVNFNYPIFVQIKQLLIISTDFSDFRKFDLTKLFKQINRLSEHLEHLELVGLSMKESTEAELNLIELQTLNIERCEISRIILNTPNLINLRLELYDQFAEKLIFNHPQSIKLMETNYYEPCITKFVNLEYLYVGQKLEIDHLRSHDKTGNEIDQFLTKLISLKELQFFTEDCTFSYLCEQKEKLKRKDFRIYYCGVNLIDNDLQNLPVSDKTPYIWLDDQSIGFYILFYFNTASILPFVKILSFDYIENCLNYVPDGLMNKFVNLKSIEVTAPVRDQSKLINLLKCLNQIRFLTFSNSNSDQQFFDLLPTYQPKLEELRVEKQAIEIDFTFVLNFKVINSLHIGVNLEHELVCDIFNKFEGLRFFYLYRDIEISLNVFGNRFEFFTYKGNSIEFENLEKLLTFVELIDIDNVEAFYQEIDDVQTDLEDYCDFNSTDSDNSI